MNGTTNRKHGVEDKRRERAPITGRHRVHPAKEREQSTGADVGSVRPPIPRNAPPA